MDSIQYNVVCSKCDCVFQPRFRSPAWWIAHKKASAGYLDAAYVHSKYCGCSKPEFVETSPFVIFGYDDMCESFIYCVPTFTAAVSAIRKHARHDIVYAKGISDAVLERLGIN